MNSSLRIATASLCCFGILAVASTAAWAKAFVLPHVLEKSGTINSKAETSDTTIYATYTRGVLGQGHGHQRGHATVSLYLFEDDGTPWMGAKGNAPVCNPCALDLDSSHRKVSFPLERLIDAAGGFGGAVEMSGFGVLVVDGDSDGVNIQGFVVNAHTSPFDLSVFGFDPQPIVAAP